LGHATEQRDVDVVIAQNIVRVDQAVLKNVISVAATLAAAATAVIPASGHEIEFVIRQFDWVSDFGHLLHDGLLSSFKVGGGMFAVTAATLSLAARRQYGCTSRTNFFAATPCAHFSFSYRANPVVDADLRNANILIDSLIDDF
jgi:hypothetical protein